MPSIGYTISRLMPGLDPESPALLDKWRTNRALFESFFGQSYPLAVYRGLEDKSLVVTIGPFADPEEHLEDFAQSEEMGDYLEEFGDILDLRGAFHVDRAWGDLPSDTPGASLTRYSVDVSRAREFEEAWAKLEAEWRLIVPKSRYCNAWRIKGGWRDVAEGDESEKLASVKRRHKKTVVSRAATLSQFAGNGSSRASGTEDGYDDDDHDDEEKTWEWVSFWAWESVEVMIQKMTALQVDVSERERGWEGLAAVVGAAKHVTMRNLVRVNYEKASREEEKQGITHIQVKEQGVMDLRDETA